MDTLYTFWDYSTHYKTESLGLMNSATKIWGIIIVTPLIALVITTH